MGSQLSALRRDDRSDLAARTIRQPRDGLAASAVAPEAVAQG